MTETTKKTIPYAPSRTELIDLYTPHYTINMIKEVFAEIRKKHPCIKKTRNLTNTQFIEVIKQLGVPQGYAKEEFPFLQNLKIY